MSFGKKLLLLPAVALLGIGVLIALFAQSISRVHETASYASVNSVPSLLVLDKAKYAFWSVRVDLWRMVAAQNASDDKALEDRTAANFVTIEQSFKDYEPLLSDDTDKALLQTDRDRIAAYQDLVRHAFDLARAGKHAEAAALVSTTPGPPTAVIAAFQAHYDYNVKLGSEADATALRTQTSATWASIGLGLALLGLISGLGYFIYRSIMGQLGGDPTLLAEVAQKVAGGDFSTAIALRRGDSTSLLATVSHMQADLKQRHEADTATLAAKERAAAEIRAAAAENSRIRTALDRVTVGVMMADNDGKIIYSNECAQNIFRSRAHQIRSQLPNFDPERILGQSIDIFHRDPSHQRNMLSRLTGNHTADIRIGGATLRIAAIPVLDHEGQRVGSVVQWLDRTQEVDIENEVNSVVASAVAGDLSAKIAEDDKQGFFKTLSAGMNQLIENMADAVRQMGRAAGEVSTGAEEISRGNLDLSQRTEEQASSLEQTAASMEQMTSTVKNNADNAAQANQLAAAARDQAERGGQVVNSAVQAMNAINDASRKIADIIGVIDDIAFQTNLLALNAAVEAARAGEQGRGFAVVASEVRSLASRSAEAAKQIKALIQDSVAKVADGTTLVDQSGQVLAEIVTGVKKVTDVMAEITASSREQASGIDQVSKAVASMDGVTQQNAALVEQASAASQTLTEQAANLMQLISRYRVAGGTAPPNAGAAPKSGTAPTERRAATRPWSKPARPHKQASATAATAAAPPPKTPSAKAPPAPKAAGGEDWQEF